MLARGLVAAWKDFINRLENRNAGVTENLSETAWSELPGAFASRVDELEFPAA
jgi:hypothetical protein